MTVQGALQPRVLEMKIWRIDGERQHSVQERRTTSDGKGWKGPGGGGGGGFSVLD